VIASQTAKLYEFTLAYVPLTSNRSTVVGAQFKCKLSRFDNDSLFAGVIESDDARTINRKWRDRGIDYSITRARSRVFSDLREFALSSTPRSNRARYTSVRRDHAIFKDQNITFMQEMYTASVHTKDQPRRVLLALCSKGPDYIAGSGRLPAEPIKMRFVTIRSLSVSIITENAIVM